MFHRLFAGFSNENCKIIPHTHLQPTLSPSPGNIKVLIFYYVIVFMFTFIWTCFSQSVIETIYIIPVQSVWTGLSPAVDWPWLLIVSTHCRHHIDYFGVAAELPAHWLLFGQYMEIRKTMARWMPRGNLKRDILKISSTLTGWTETVCQNQRTGGRNCWSPSRQRTSGPGLTGQDRTSVGKLQETGGELCNGEFVTNVWQYGEEENF